MRSTRTTALSSSTAISTDSSASADDLGFKFDRHAARNELQAATFGRKRKAMARLLLSPTGTMAIELKPFEAPGAVPVTVAVRPLPVDPGDFRLRYKTTDRAFSTKRGGQAGPLRRSSPIPRAS